MNVFDLYAKLGLDTSEYESKLDAAKSMGSKFGGALATTAKVGLAAVTAATGATVAFAKSAVSAGAEFDSSMSQVAATMGKTMSEMESEVGSVDLAWGTFSGNLREYAQEMGKNTAFSATEAADALNYMALAGYDTQTSMEMLPNVLNLAAAGSMDLATASDMVTDTQTAFGISLERTSQMVDEMAKAASTGNTSVEQLGEAFLTVGGLAQELNGGLVTLEDGTTASVDGVQELEIALTAMANAGVKGTEAGTHMRNMLLKLSSPTSDGVKQLNALGVSVFDAEGNMRSLSNVFGDLNGALSNLTQEEKIQAISDLFNTRDLASAEALLNAVGEDWDSIGASILDAEGAAGQMANTQLDNLAGDITLFKSALEGAQIAVSDVLTPSLREFVQFGTEGLSKLTSAFQEGGLEGAMSAFGDILSEGLQKIISKAPEFVKAGIELLSALGRGLMDNIDVILFAIGDVVEMILQGMLDSSRNGESTILSIIDWILGVFEENYMQFIDMGFEIITNILQGLAKSDNSIGFYISEIISHLIEVFTEYAPVMLTAAMEIITNLISSISEMLPTLIPQLVEAFVSVLTGLLSNADLLIDAAINLVLGLVEGIINALPILIESLPKVIQAIVDGIIDGLPKLIEGAIKLVTMLVTHLPEIIAGLINAIPEIIASILSAFGPIGEGLAMLFTGAWNGIKEVFSDVGDFFSERWNTVKDTTEKVWNAISAKVEKNGGGIKGFLQTIGEGISQNWRNRFIEMNEATGGKLGEMLVSVRDRLSEMKNKFLDLGNSAATWGRDLIQNFLNGIMEKWNALKETVSNVAQTVKDFIGFSEPAKGPLSNFHTFAPDMMNLFAQGIRDNEGMLMNTVADAFDFQDAITDVGALSVNGGYNYGMGYSSSSGLTDAVMSALQGIVVEVNIGTERIDGIVSKAIQRTNYRSGGR